MSRVDEYRGGMVQAIPPLFNKNDVVVVGSLPGVGKTHCSNEICYRMYKSGYPVVIAVENLSKVKEVCERFKDENVKVIVGKNAGTCIHYREKSKADQLSLGRISCEICENCEEPCDKNSFDVEDSFIIITTHAYLRKSRPLQNLLSEMVGLLYIDEDSLFLSKDGSSHVHLTTQELRRYTRMLVEDLPRLSSACANAAVGRLTEVIQSLNLDEERVLFELNTPNIVDDLNTVVKLGIKVLNRRYTIFKQIPLYSNFLLVGGVGLSAALVRPLLPGKKVVDYMVPEDHVPPENRFIRVENAIGSVTHMMHPSNQRTIAELAIQIGSGKKVVMVCKKAVIEKMRDALSVFTNRTVIICDGSEPVGDSDIPLISFGAKGYNTFIDYDVVICLGAYNTTVDIIEEHMSFLSGYKRVYSLEITAERSIQGTNLDIREQAISEYLLEFYERSCVLQTIGRIRPFTLPGKTVITMQRTTVMEGETVVKTLQELRSMFGVRTRREAKKTDRSKEIEKLIESGASVSAAARELNISRTTIHKYLRRVE